MINLVLDCMCFVLFLFVLFYIVCSHCSTCFSESPVSSLVNYRMSFAQANIMQNILYMSKYISVHFKCMILVLLIHLIHYKKKNLNCFSPTKIMPVHFSCQPVACLLQKHNMILIIYILNIWLHIESCILGQTNKGCNACKHIYWFPAGSREYLERVRLYFGIASV